MRYKMKKLNSIALLITVLFGLGLNTIALADDMDSSTPSMESESTTPEGMPMPTEEEPSSEESNSEVYSPEE